MNDDMMINEVKICNNALYDIPTILNKIGISSCVMLVCDKNTYKAAGSLLRDILIEKNLDVLLCMLKREGNLIPDERAVGEVLTSLENRVEIMIAVGSGTINDIVKFVSSKTKIPYGIVATAPSMDGYASSVSPLIVNGFKRTYNATCPVFIVGDTNILKDAPYDMITSGFGDIIGKFTSLSDWYIGSVITEEEYSKEIAETTRQSLNDCVDVAKSLKNKDENAVKKLMDALILSGLSMLKFGNSRPASGAEHHLSHFIEMKELLSGGIEHSHGAKVGIMTRMSVSLFNAVFSLNEDEVKKLMEERKHETKEEFEFRIRKNFGPMADEVFKDIDHYYIDEELRRVRQKRILKNWDTMKKWVSENVPSSDYIDDLLNDVEAPSDISYLGLQKSELKNILMNAKEMRKRYTILRLAEDINLDRILDLAIKN